MHTKNRKKILHIIGQLGLGGAERQLYLLIDGLADRYQFTVLAYDLERLDYLEPLRKLGIDVRIIPKGPGLWGRIRFLIGIVRVIRELSPDIVQTWLTSANFWGRLAALLSGTKAHIIASVRNVVPGISNIEIIADRFLTRETDIIISNTSAGKLAMTSYGIPAGKVRVVHNGIEYDRYDFPETKEQVQEELLIPSGRFVIGTVGRIMLQKNHLMLLKAAQELAGLDGRLHFVIVGDGELRSIVESKIAECGMEHTFTLTGMRKDVERALKAFDLFVLTSSWEGLPNVIMEAMCAKLPVIATDVGGVSELIENAATGLLVEKDDLKGLVDAIKRLVGDAGLRASLGGAARHEMENRFSVARMVGNTGLIYEEVLSEDRQGGTH